MLMLCNCCLSEQTLELLRIDRSTARPHDNWSLVTRLANAGDKILRLAH
ncbi:hypothetical protein PLANPX_0902 [Lacipirellula parvula]|uniref:Uncharacterized protein n=1 Tax=Lacipirellula parvula TaxID=2650471 RepID=A0A5K7X441_9BACT|nr:hypothetical protein PLANPX_0902 [Lacipirellula parvula]